MPGSSLRHACLVWNTLAARCSRIDAWQPPARHVCRYAEYAEWLISSGLNDSETVEDCLLTAADTIMEFDMGEEDGEEDGDESGVESLKQRSAAFVGLPGDDLEAKVGFNLKIN
eukprot:363865-Chlamydomonas_euryale.AAC.30